MEEDVGTASVTSDGTSTLTPQILQSIFPETSYRAVFVIRDPRDVITSSYLSIMSTLDAWARTKRDDLKGLSFQSVMRNLNAEVALNVEIARFMSASTDVPFFTGLDNAATAEIEKSNGAYANAILSFAEAMLDSEDSTMKDTTIFVKYTDLLSANSTGFRKLSQFLRGDASLEQSFLAAAASLRSRVETEPSLIASLVSKNDDTFYRHKITVDNVRKSTDEIATPPNIFKLHFTVKQLAIIGGTLVLVTAAALLGVVNHQGRALLIGTTTLMLALIYPASGEIGRAGPLLGALFDDSIVAFALYVLFVFALSLAAVWVGVAASNRVLINVGIVTCAFIIFIQYFAWSFHMLPTSFAFIVGGAVLIGVSFAMERFRRRALARMTGT